MKTPQPGAHPPRHAPDARKRLHEALRTMNPAWGTSPAQRTAESAAMIFLGIVEMHGFEVTEKVIHDAAQFAVLTMQGTYDAPIPEWVDKDAPW